MPVESSQGSDLPSLPPYWRRDWNVKPSQPAYGDVPKADSENDDVGSSNLFNQDSNHSDKEKQDFNENLTQAPSVNEKDSNPRNHVDLNKEELQELVSGVDFRVNFSLSQKDSEKDLNELVSDFDFSEKFSLSQM